MLKRATAYSVILMLFVFLFSVCFEDNSKSVSFASEKSPTPSIIEVNKNPNSDSDNVNSSEESAGVWANVAGKDQLDLSSQLGSKFIIIEKPELLSETAVISLEDLAVDRSIVITIDGLSGFQINPDHFGRVSEKSYFQGMPFVPTKTPVFTGAENTITEEAIVETTDLDPVKSLTLEYSEVKQNGTYAVNVTIGLDTTYAYKIFEDDYNYYVALLRPKDVYERIIVVDAGHGGLDSGTYSKGSEYLEKDMNLSMLLHLKEYLEQEDIKVYYTRTTDRKPTLSQRVELANAVEADLFLSIHCNSNLSSEVDGIEVLYNEKQNDWESFNSKQFSKICLEEVNKLIGLDDRGLVPRSHNVTIIAESKVPIALVEVAFMSNQNDLSFLLKEENRRLVAKGMYNAILRAYEVLDNDVSVE